MDKIKRVLDVVRRNKLFTGALAAGAVLRLLTVLGYPGALWFAGDSYVYLGAALRPEPDLSKATGYSFFLRALLPFHSLTLVVVAQHLMGLADAVIIYALLRRTKVSRKWATVATLPMLLDAFVIEDEHLIMTEALFTFLIMIALALVLWRPTISWWKALVAGLLLGYAAVVRTEGEAVLIVFPLYLLIRGWAWKTVRGWAMAALMCIGIAAPLGGYMAWFDSQHGSFDTTLAQGFFVWGRVSSFADCAVIKPAGELARVCPTQPVKDRSAPGNYIWHAPYVHQNISNIGGPVSPRGNTLLTSFAIKAAEAQPLAYAKTVIKGTLLSFGFPREAYPGPGTTYYYSFHAHYKTAQHDMLPPTAADKKKSSWIPGGTAYGDWLSYGHQVPGAVDPFFAYPMIGYQKVFYTWGPLLAVIFLAGLGGVFAVRRRGWTLRRAWDVRKPRLVWQIRGTSMLPWITAVVLLVAPVAVADFDYRYLIPAIPFASLAAGLAFAPRRRRGTPAPGPAAAPGSREPAVPDSVA